MSLKSFLRWLFEGGFAARSDEVMPHMIPETKQPQQAFPAQGAATPPLKLYEEPDEKVLCFYASYLDALGRFQGVMKGAGIEEYKQKILGTGHLFYVDRKLAEADVSLKQVIPYVLLRRSNHVFKYFRNKTGGESRLHGKWSIGVGGHINPCDGNGAEAYERAFIRELNEEVALPVELTRTQRIIGLINDDSNDVGRVHFGVVHEIQVDFATLEFRDPAISGGSFQSPKSLMDAIASFENWSKLVIENLL